jgi:hypothetical protein
MSAARAKDHSVTDSQIVCLYRDLLVPWETAYGAVVNHWSAQYIEDWPSSMTLTVSSVTAQELDETLQAFLDDNKLNFFVFVRRKSKGRDLFCHLRNAVAHAGVSRHPQLHGAALLRFKTPGPNKKGVTMVGQLEERHLPDLLTKLHAMAKSALERSEA